MLSLTLPDKNISWYECDRNSFERTTFQWGTKTGPTLKGPLGHVSTQISESFYTHVVGVRGELYAKIKLTLNLRLNNFERHKLVHQIT